MNSQSPTPFSQSLKHRVERAIGDEFVSWLNQASGGRFHFERAGADPPDLIYADRDKTLPLEITTAYYDQEDASALWRLARKDPAVPVKRAQPLDKPDRKLIASITKRIAEKCFGTHDAGTILVIDVYPAITRKGEFEALKHEITIPKKIPFAAIYVTGWFPSDGDGWGVYSCWKVSDDEPA